MMLAKLGLKIVAIVAVYILFTFCGSVWAQTNSPIVTLFKRLDELGRDKVQAAKFVTVKFANLNQPGQERSTDAWLISEDNQSITLLEDDLIPRTYRKDAKSMLPSSWGAVPIQFKAATPADFPALCDKLKQPEPASEPGRNLHKPGPSQRFLVAHAAWKRGAIGYEQILAQDPLFQGVMSPPEKQFVIAEIQRWYVDSKDQTPDDRMYAFFSSPRSEDWITAAKYFLKQKNNRAVAPLLKRIGDAQSFTKGELCELVAKFGDPEAKDALLDVMENAQEASDQIAAAMALWDLGDSSGVAVAIDFLKGEKQPYGGWETPTWFLVRTHTKEGLEALRSVVMEGQPRRAGECLRYIEKSITGDMSSRQREPAGCIEICPLLIAAMSRADDTGDRKNDHPVRYKDLAAIAFATLRQGWKTQFGRPSINFDPMLFDQWERDEQKRDAQIQSLIAWYEQHKDKLTWDTKAHKLKVDSKLPQK